jgi:hypothetical protein
VAVHWTNSHGRTDGPVSVVTDFCLVPTDQDENSEDPASYPVYNRAVPETRQIRRDPAVPDYSRALREVVMPSLAASLREVGPCRHCAGFFEKQCQRPAWRPAFCQ